MTMVDDPARYAADALVDYCAAVFIALRMPEDDAGRTALSLVEADLRGVDSHGVVRLKIYADRLKAGVVNPRPTVEIVRETRQSAVVDGGNGMGQVVGEAAMTIALDKAASGEPSFVSVRNSNHFGTAAWFAEMACPRDMIGFALTIGGINHMVPWGGAEAMLGNNPFAVALPMRGEPPVVLDMACSVAARGKIIVAAKEGRPIPADWAVDAEGRPTTDAEEALKGFVSPVGGAKGYALTLVVGLLSTMLSRAAFGSEVGHMYENFTHPQNIGHLHGALPIAAFEDLDVFYERMRKAGEDVRRVRKAPGVERIYLPGEREARLRDKRRREGVPIAREVAAECAAVGAALGLTMPPAIGSGPVEL